MLHSHIAQEVDRIELTLLIHDVVAHIVAAHEHLGSLGIAEELLGFSIGQIEGQADGPLPVLTDGL